MCEHGLARHRGYGASNGLRRAEGRNNAHARGAMEVAAIRRHAVTAAVGRSAAVMLHALLIGVHGGTGLGCERQAGGQQAEQQGENATTEH